MTVSGAYSLHVDWNNNGLFDDGEMSGDIVDVVIERGFSTPLARMCYTGRATFHLQNVDQSYSPLLNTGQVPMRQVRFRMTFDGQTKTLFRGFLAAIQPQSLSPGPPKHVFLHCVDATALMDLREVSIPIQIGANAKTLIAALVAEVYTPPATNYQDGINAFPISADRWSLDGQVGYRFHSNRNQPTEDQIMASSKITDVCASDWGRFFVDGQGRPAFVNRHDQLLDTTPRLTLVNQMHGMGYQRNVEDIVNTVDVIYSPRVVGEVAEVLGTLSQGTSVKLEAGATEEFTIRFRDPSNPALDIAAYEIASLLAGVDYAATDDEQGEGLDKTANMATNLSFTGATEVRIEVTNTDTADIYIQKLQVRGRAVRTRREEKAHAEDSSSIADYDTRRIPGGLSAPLMSNHSQAQLLADHLVERYKDPVERVEGLRIYGNRNTTFLSAVRDMELLDPIRVTEDHLGLSNFDGLVYQLVHNIRYPEFHELVVAIHKPYQVAGTICRLDQTTFSSNHVLVY